MYICIYNIQYTITYGCSGLRCDEAGVRRPGFDDPLERILVFVLCYMPYVIVCVIMLYVIVHVPSSGVTAFRHSHSEDRFYPRRDKCQNCYPTNQAFHK